MSDRRIANAHALAEVGDEERAKGIKTLATLLKGRKHTRESVIPGTSIGFVWRVLSGREKQECLASALARFAEMGMPPELRHYTDLEDEVTWQMLARAMRDPDHPGESDPYPRPLADVNEIRDALTVDERDLLMSEYMDLEEEVDPDPLFQSDEWHTEVEAALKKKTKADCVAALSRFGSRMLSGYLLSTVRPRLISPIGKSSSSPDDTKTQPDPSQTT